jgi:signal peptidase I
VSQEDPALFSEMTAEDAREPESLGASSEADSPASKSAGRPGRGGSVEALVLVVLAFVLALFLKQYVAEAYEIKGRSMEPTFQNGQRVVVLKAFYGLETGDIVVFASTEDPTKDLIKRIVAGPQDELSVVNGKLKVNDELVDEGYLLGRETGFEYESRLPHPNPLPEGEYWVLGDNRPDSHDSRYFGPIPAESIKGKVVVRWWPFDSLRSF